MRRHVTLALAAAVALGAASQANAAITMTITNVPINTTLTNAGWGGYLIHLHADAGEVINSAEFANPYGTIANPGITGPMHQATVEDFDVDGNDLGTITTPTPIKSGGLLNIELRTDSSYLSKTYWQVLLPENLSESNTQTGSPLSNATDQYQSTNNVNSAVPTKWGVGSSLKMVGSSSSGQVTELDFALIIAQLGASNVILNGAVLNSVGGDTGTYEFKNIVVNAPAVPEPASLGVLALGGLSLLAKRRKRA